jgi:8-oxo-dGTP pyrophosphatase MutT (NUDIX family)
VLAAVLRRGAHVLVCQGPHHKRHGGLWEFPGGKLEPGESLLEAATRELREELGVTVTWAGAPLFVRADPGSVFVIEFVPVRVDGEPAAHEHEALAWVAPADALALPLAPADRAFAEFLLTAPAAASTRGAVG